MKTAIRLTVCFAVVCLFTEGKAQYYSGVRLEYHKRLDHPVLTFYDPDNGITEKASFEHEKMNVGVYEFTTCRLNDHFTIGEEIGYIIHSTNYKFSSGNDNFFQRIFDFRLLPGYASKRNIIAFQAGPTMSIVLHSKVNGYSEKEKTKWIWWGSCASVHLRVNRAMFYAGYNRYFTKGNIDFVRPSYNTSYKLENRRSYFSFGVSVIVGGQYN